MSATRTVLLVGGGLAAGYVVWRLAFKEEDTCAGFGVGAGAATGAAVGGPWGAVIGAGASLLCPMRGKLTEIVERIAGGAAQGVRSIGGAATALPRSAAKIGKHLVTLDFGYGSREGSYFYNEYQRRRREEGR